MRHEYEHKSAKVMGHDATFIGAKKKAIESKKGKNKAKLENICDTCGQGHKTSEHK